MKAPEMVVKLGELTHAGLLGGGCSEAADVRCPVGCPVVRRLGFLACGSNRGPVRPGV